MKVLIIIPAYNEEKSIATVVNNLIENYPQYDYVVVNDGSKDRTVEICKNNGFNYIDLPLNLGIGGGVQAGYLYAAHNQYDIAIQMDGDGQHNPEYLDKIIAPIAEGKADITIGSRFIKKEGFQTSFMRRLGISILRFFIKLCCGHNATDATSGFRAASKSAIAIFSEEYAQDYPEPEAIVAGILHGLRIVEVPVIMNERHEGVSSISGLRSVYYMVKVSLAVALFRLRLKPCKENAR